MSIEFDRRTFLKTSAALIGCGALMGLTGCDSSSSSSHPINHKISAGEKFDVGGIYVEDTSLGGFKEDYYSVKFVFSKVTSSYEAETIYSDAFSASYKGKVLDILSVEVDGKPCQRVDIFKDQRVTVTVKFTGFFASVDPADFHNNLIYKFHYNDTSIKFQNGMTSKPYAEKLSL